MERMSDAQLAEFRSRLVLYHDELPDGLISIMREYAECVENEWGLNDSEYEFCMGLFKDHLEEQVAQYGTT